MKMVDKTKIRVAVVEGIYADLCGLVPESEIIRCSVVCQGFSLWVLC